MSFNNIFTQPDNAIHIFFFEKLIWMVSPARCIVPKSVSGEQDLKNTGKIEKWYRYVLLVWVLNKRCFKIIIIINAFIVFYAHTTMVLRIGSDVSEVFSLPSPHEWSVTQPDDVPTDPSDDALGTSNRVASSRFQFSRHCASPDWRKLNKQK